MSSGVEALLDVFDETAEVITASTLFDASEPPLMSSSCCVNNLVARLGLASAAFRKGDDRRDTGGEEVKVDEEIEDVDPDRASGLVRASLPLLRADDGSTEEESE